MTNADFDSIPYFFVLCMFVCLFGNLSKCCFKPFVMCRVLGTAHSRASSRMHWCQPLAQLPSGIGVCRSRMMSMGCQDKKSSVLPFFFLWRSTKGIEKKGYLIPRSLVNTDLSQSSGGCNDTEVNQVKNKHQKTPSSFASSPDTFFF